MKPQDAPSNVDEDIVGGVTSVEEIINALARRGCLDLTPSIDLAACSDFPRAGGGFCDVYHGALHDGTQIAIKALRVYDQAPGDGGRQRILKRAAKELYHWSKLKHCNVLPLLGLAVFRGCLSMISGWMENGNLMVYLRLNPDADRVKLCMEVCAGLYYIHANGMVHGDLKAANIMVSLDGTAMIADFGNAQLKDLTLKFANTPTRAFSIRWAAPELLLEDNVPQASMEADVYAYGMTVLEALTGKVPYEGLSDNRVIILVALEKRFPPRPNVGICDGLWNVLISCWAREPSKRPNVTTISSRLHALFWDGDLLMMLPPKLALHVLAQLDLHSIITCLTVSHAWRRLVSSDAVWRTLFYRQSGWFVNISRRRAEILAAHAGPATQLPPPRPQTRLPPALSSHCDQDSFIHEHSLNWLDLYKQRHRIERKWYFDAPRSKILSGHLGSIYCLELDASTGTIATGSRDCSIKIWNVSSGELRETLVAHEGSVLCLKADFARGFMCSGSIDQTIRVWVRNSIGVWGVKAVLDRRGVLDLTMDDRWIASCSKDTLICMWDRQTLRLHCVLMGHKGPVNAVGLQGKHVVSASEDGTMILWDIESGSRIRTFSGHDKGLTCVEFKDDTIISGAYDRKIKVWSASSGECVMTFLGHERHVYALAYDANTGRLVSASRDRTIKVWEFKKGMEGWKFVREFRNLHEGYVSAVKFDATKIISASLDQKIVVLDFAYDSDGSLFT